jgi:acetolactate synthase-1/2/3 large subunit
MKTLIENGVEVCFGNPGTSEMHLVDAIAKTDQMKGILGLFEGVVTGAADGYARMARKPAATLLHLGPGLANGAANIHNAQRARSPMINIIGQHALDHLQYESPLKSDVEAIASPFCDHVKTTTDVNELSADTATAIAAANGVVGKIASLIVPADIAWSETDNAKVVKATQVIADTASNALLEQAIDWLGSEKTTALLIDDACLFGEALVNAGRIARATGATLLCPTFYARAQRGAGTVPVLRIPYFAEDATAALESFQQVILIGSRVPVSFFAYPGKPSWLLPDGCDIMTLTEQDQDSPQALKRLAAALKVSAGDYDAHPSQLPEVPQGPLTPESAAACIARHMPVDSIVVDEGITSSFPAYSITAGAARHDWLTVTGGSIGQGLPAAVGCAVACPNRKVISLEGDGSAMYTVQALWTMANQDLDITVVLYANHSYKILNVEMIRVGVEAPSPKASEMLEIEGPCLDWVALTTGMGLPVSEATTAAEFEEQIAKAMAAKGPQLIIATVSKEL